MTSCSQQINRGAFRKGVSGNPGGRPAHRLPDGRSLTELAREHTDAAVRTLAAVLQDARSPAAAKVSAAAALLDRGWGRPPQYVALSEQRAEPMFNEFTAAARIAALLESARERASAQTADIDPDGTTSPDPSLLDHSMRESEAAS